MASLVRKMSPLYVCRDFFLPESEVHTIFFNELECAVLGGFGTEK